MTDRFRNSRIAGGLAACLSIVALAAWASPLDPPPERSQVAGVGSPASCGDGVLDADEECDDGGACLGGASEGEPCAGADDCPGGDCRPFGGDGCAENCTFETVHRLSVDAASSSVVILLTPATEFAPMVVSGLARVTVVAGGPDEEGRIPLAVPAAELNLPLPITPINECICLRAIEDPASGPGNAGAGGVRCGSEGMDGNDILVRRDHDIGDTDAGCATGTPDPVHPGTCNGPEQIERSMPGPSGSAVVPVHVEIYEVPSNGTCAVDPALRACGPASANRGAPCSSDSECGGGTCLLANGADGIPCTDDDPTGADPGFRGTLYLTTGTTRAEILDLGNMPGTDLVGRSATGMPFVCNALAAAPADAGEVVLAGALAVLDYPVHFPGFPPADLAWALALGFGPEFAGGGVCGNGRLDAGEECDDGNAVDGDGCDWSCQASRCGNGRIVPGEECDDGNADPVDGCTDHCTVCGNGSVLPPEECDDGNLFNNDDCDANCTATACGNGVATAGEECDDGNAVNGDGCDVNCTVTACGNGVVSPGEECDDGNTDAGDGCDPGCVRECGNGRLDAEELCDDGNRVDGDGCDSNCTWTRCGNGIVTAGEECDDGNTDPFDGCTLGCTRCGNGVADGAEECDDGNRVDSDGCTSACTRCGDGRIAAPERCDDGNLENGDGCDVNCTPSGCGNGVAETDEQCDDGGVCVGGAGAGRACHDPLGCDSGTCEAVGGDGCSARCTVEHRHRLRLDPDRSQVEVRVGPATLTFALSGEMVLTTGREDEAGVVPLSVRVADWHIDPIALDANSYQSASCLCLDAVEAPGAEPGQAGGGTISCGAGGASDVEVTSSIDHDTSDVDPACADGNIETDTSCIAGSCGENGRACFDDDGCRALHPGVCNGPEVRTVSGSGPPGSALLEIGLSARYLFDTECSVEACAAARQSADIGTTSRSAGTADPRLDASTGERMAALGYPVPLPPLLPLPAAMQAIFTTAVARGEIADARPILPPNRITAEAEGRPFVCRADNLGLHAGAVLAAVVPSLDNPRLGDSVAAFTLALVQPCPGDCGGDGAVGIDELITLVNGALDGADVAACTAGDENADGRITIDEIVAAVGNALAGCPVTSPEESCIASGGTVSAGQCCSGAGDFPDTCAIGPCGCAPDASEQVALCDCGEQRCFDRALAGCVPDLGPLPGEPLLRGAVAVLDNADPDRLSVRTSAGSELWSATDFDISDASGAWRALSISPDGRYLAAADYDRGWLRAFDARGAMLFERRDRYWSVDTTPDRVYALTSDGTFKGAELHVLARDGQLIRRAPIGGFDLVVDRTRGMIWTVGEDIKKVDLGLNVLFALDPFSHAGISIDLAADGSIWAAEFGTTPRLLHVAPDGSLLKTVDLEASPTCVRVDRGTGDLWVMMGERGRRYTAAGEPMQPLRSATWGLAIDEGDHSLWVGAADGLKHFTATGALIRAYTHGLSANRAKFVAVFGGAE